MCLESGHDALTGYDLALHVITQMVESISSILPKNTELVVHDLRKLPDSAIYVHGDLTNRTIDDPATRQLMRWSEVGYPETTQNTQATLADGRIFKSTTIILRDSLGIEFAALCINSDITHWHHLYEISSAMVSSHSYVNEIQNSVSSYKNINDSLESLIEQAENYIGIPIRKMNRKQRIRFIQYLEDKGFFLVKNSTQSVADMLGVTRFTIYNYLKKDL